MPQRPAFFTREGDHYLPTEAAHSHWSDDSLNGPAVCGLAAAVVEAGHGRSGWRPARFTLDLFKNARRLPTAVSTQVLRAGGRILAVQVQLRQRADDGTESLVAQGVTVFLKEGTDPPGERWQRPASARTFTPPESSGEAAYFGDDVQGWTTDMAAHQHGRRHRLWTVANRITEESEPTPFVRAVVNGESASLMTNWGSDGIGFINCDLTVSLVRLPRGERIGVEADDHLEADGISTGTATLHDADGPFGVAVVTAVDNSRALIDFTEQEPVTFREA